MKIGKEGVHFNKVVLMGLAASAVSTAVGLGALGAFFNSNFSPISPQILQGRIQAMPEALQACIIPKIKKMGSDSAVSQFSLSRMTSECQDEGIRQEQLRVLPLGPH